jgi:hypothetical protein
VPRQKVTTGPERGQDSCASPINYLLDSRWNADTWLWAHAPFVLQQGKHSIRWHDGCIVDHHLLKLVFDNLSRVNVQLVHGNAVHVQGLAQRHFGYQDRMPRHSNGGSGKIVYHSVLKTRSFLEPKFDKLLHKFDRALVAFESRKLDSRWIYYSDFRVIDAVV